MTGCKIQRGIDLLFRNWHELLTRGIDNLCFNGLSLSKVYNVCAKKAQKVIFDGTED